MNPFLCSDPKLFDGGIKQKLFTFSFVIETHRGHPPIFREHHPVHDAPGHLNFSGGDAAICLGNMSHDLKRRPEKGHL